jgi:hypothetical protein
MLADFQAFINETLYQFQDIFLTPYYDYVLISSNGLDKDHGHVLLDIVILRSPDHHLKPKKCSFYQYLPYILAS